MSVVRAWHVAEALTSFRRLNNVLPELTEDEVVHALALEQSAQRRKSITSRLTARLAQFHKEHFNAQSKISNSFPG